jgi:O-antigen/teichoic acid export membrane protein/glycosyltransferase involved in cell wall biosynthesis
LNLLDHFYRAYEAALAKASKIMSSKISSHWPLTIFSTLSSLANLALPLVLVRVLPPEEIGNYKVFFLFIGLMPWLAMSAGIGNGLYHWSAKADFQHYFNLSWTLLSLWALLLGGSLALFSPHLPGGRFFAAGAALILVSNFHEDSLVATGETWRGALFGAFFEILRAGLLLAAAIEGRSLRWVIVAYVTGLACKTLAGAFFGWRLRLARWTFPLADAEGERLRALLHYAIPVSFAAFLAVATHYSDQIILARIASPAYFAGYALACLTVPPLNSFEQSIGRILIPSLARLEGAPQSSCFREAVAELAWILLPATAGLLVFADPIIRLLFTEKYAASAGFLRLYAFNYLLLAFPYDAFARASGDSRFILRNLAIAFLLALVVIPLLSLRYLGLGALSGLLLTQLALRVGGFWHVKKKTGWTLGEILPLDELAFDLGTTLLLAFLCLAARPLFPRPLPWFFLCGPAFTFLYLGTTARIRISRQLSSRERPAVLLLTQYLEMGGLEKVIQTLCGQFTASGELEPFVAYYDRRPGAHALDSEFGAIPVHAFSKGPGFSLRLALRLFRFCLREKIAIVHTHDLGPLLYASFAKLLSLGTLRIVHTQHSFVHLASRRRHALYEKIFTRFADELVAVSPETRSIYEKIGVKAERIRVITNGVEFPSAPLTSEGRAQLRTRLAGGLACTPVSGEENTRLADCLDREWVLYLARLHRRKGQNHALHLWSLLSEARRSRAILLFVGQESGAGEEARLREQAASLPPGSRVVFAGPSNKPLDWLQASDLLLSLSEFEGMPLSPIEARGSGLPLVLSRIPGHGFFPKTTTWIDLPPGKESAEAMEIALAHAAAQGAGSSEAAFAAAAPWREQFGARAMASAYSDCYFPRKSGKKGRQ